MGPSHDVQPWFGAAPPPSRALPLERDRALRLLPYRPRMYGSVAGRRQPQDNIQGIAGGERRTRTPIFLTKAVPGGPYRPTSSRRIGSRTKLRQEEQP